LLSRYSKLAKECETVRHALFSYKSAVTEKSFPTKAYDASSYSEQERTYRDLNPLVLFVDYVLQSIIRAKLLFRRNIFLQPFDPTLYRPRGKSKLFLLWSIGLRF